jgi:diguanylate cyclase (GGDEF)-like protein/PAS domain S-box-containing protein
MTVHDFPDHVGMGHSGDAVAAGRALQEDVRDAWASRSFDLAYQPQINLATNRVIGFEALLRWRHPMRGQVPPGAFIPVAEETGLIGEMGAWVLGRACHDAVTWADPVTVAVNVSAIQLRDAGLLDAIAAALRESGLPPSRLELEITESAMLPGDDATLAVLRAIRESGVRIAIDDLGAGYSSFSSLLRFLFDKVKIDRSFTAGLADTEDRGRTARAIVRSIVELCERLDIACVAEGVETRDQVAALVEANCKEVQGFLFGHPMPAGHVSHFLRSMNLAGGGAGVRATSKLPDAAFLRIADTANDIIIVTTPDLTAPGPTIVYVNPAFTRLTGYSAAEAIGRSPRMLQGPGTSRATLHAVGAALRAGRPVHEKILNYAKSGAPYWLDLRIVPLRDQAGAITHFAAIERDVTLDKRRLDELEHVADRDTLTGIPNRRAFLRAAEGAIAAVGASGLCLALIDVDHFKQVNDTLGDAVGDAVLCGVADRLADNVRRSDMLARIGGEEFALCMPAVGPRDARAFAESLVTTVAGTRIDTQSGPVRISVSIGIASYQPGDNVAGLMDRADSAMVAAKRAGRNRVRVHVAPLSAPVSASMAG